MVNVPLGLFAGEVQEVIVKGSTWTAIGILTLSGALVPVLEEYVYRGFLLTSLARDLPMPLAVRSSPQQFPPPLRPTCKAVNACCCKSDWEKARKRCRRIGMLLLCKAYRQGLAAAAINKYSSRKGRKASMYCRAYLLCS